MFVETRNNEKYRGNLGVTLVELLVAAVILAVGVGALLSIVIVMQKERIEDYHRRQARTAINRIFEGAFNIHDCPGPYTVSKMLVDPSYTSSDSLITVYVNSAAGNTTKTLKSGAELPKVLIDNRAGYAKIEGNMNARFDYDEITVTGKSTPIETHKLTVTVKWKETGANDSSLITLERRLTETTRGY
jgi:Tfp pilus assembly protein PilE